MANVFVSYPSVDSGHLAAIESAIAAADPGGSVWTAGALKGGDLYWERIEEQIEACDLVVMLITRAALTGDGVKQELRIAERLGKHIVPILKESEVVAEDLRSTDFGTLLETVHMVHFNLRLGTAVKQRLTEGIRKQLDGQPPPPVPGAQQSKVLSFVNFKGGVGKTTLCALTGIWLARNTSGRAVIVDLDPQENLTDVLGLASKIGERKGSGLTALGTFEPYRIGRNTAAHHDNAYGAIHAGLFDPDVYDRLPTPVLETGPSGGRLDVVVGDARMSKFGQGGGELVEVFAHNFGQAILALKDSYDFVLIDSGPAATLLSRCALASADTIIAPVRAQHTSTRGLVHMMAAARDLFGIDVRNRVRPLFNMARRHIQYERGYLEVFADDPGQCLSPELAPLRGQEFESVIPLAATMTDPMRVIGDILKKDGDLNPLGAARGAIEAFCSELLPEGGLFEPNRPDDDLFGPEGAAAAPNAPGPRPNGPTSSPAAEDEPMKEKLRRWERAKEGIDRVKAPPVDPAAARSSKTKEKRPRNEAQHPSAFIRVSGEITLIAKSKADRGRKYLDILEAMAVHDGVRPTIPPERTADGIAHWLLACLSEADALKLVRYANQFG
ncbi:MAG: AAA family ATPase [Pseudomonadota bacterium]